MPQTDLKKARAKASKLGVEVRKSTRKGKKLDVYDPRGKFLHAIGDLRYSDFLQHNDEKRRDRYKTRHNKHRHIKGSASYYADQILW